MSFSIANLTFRYPNADEDSLTGVSVRVPAGQTVAVLGPSGCGKSTLLNLLGLLWEQTWPTGRVVFHGHDPAGTPRDYDFANLHRRDRAELRSRQFGFVLQSNYVLPHFTCVQNVAMPLALLGWSHTDRHLWASALLRQLDEIGDLAQRADKPGREVSLGQRQRMAVLRAVAHDPQVVFADEPFSNLDSKNADAVVRLLTNWRSGQLHREVAANLLQKGGLSGELAGHLRRWAEGPTRERTLLLVCHHRDRARETADYFLQFDAGHRLAVHFPRAEWGRHQPQEDRPA